MTCKFIEIAQGQNSQGDLHKRAINFYCRHGDVQVVAAPTKAAGLPRVVGVPSGGVSDS